MAVTSGWIQSEQSCDVGNNQESNNASGFSTVPGGDRLEYGGFNPNGYSANWWGSDDNPVSITINFGSAFVGNSLAHKNYGVSVRCIKDK
jgi:uncharacterized protein (TIGR02145 family)